MFVASLRSILTESVSSRTASSPCNYIHNMCLLLCCLVYILGYTQWLYVCDFKCTNYKHLKLYDRSSVLIWFGDTVSYSDAV